MDELISFAAEVLGVPPGTLSPDSAFGSVPAWDSVMHLRLVMEIEARYGVRLPFEKLPQIRSLRDFLPYLEGGAQ